MNWIWKISMKINEKYSWKCKKSNQAILWKSLHDNWSRLLITIYSHAKFWRFFICEF